MYKMGCFIMWVRESKDIRERTAAVALGLGAIEVSVELIFILRVVEMFR